MNILITGITGFLGTNLFNKFLLSSNFNIFVLAKRNESKTLDKRILKRCTVIESDFVNDDVSNLLPTEIDVLLHLAWCGANGTEKGLVESQNKNLSILHFIYKVIKNIKVKKIIGIGSISEFSYLRLNDKDGILSPTLLYGKYKTEVKKRLLTYCARHDIDFKWLRLSSIYSLDLKNDTVLTYALRSLNEHLDCYFGPCLNYYNFILVDDVCNAIFKFVSSKIISKKHTFSISSNMSLRLWEYLKIIGTVYGMENKIHTNSRNDDGTVFLKKDFECSHTINYIGEFETSNFNENIKKIYNNYSRNKNE